MSDHDPTKCEGCQAFAIFVQEMDPAAEAAILAAVVTTWRQLGPTTPAEAIIDFITAQARVCTEAIAPTLAKRVKEVM